MLQHKNYQGRSRHPSHPSHRTCWIAASALFFMLAGAPGCELADDMDPMPLAADDMDPMSPETDDTEPLAAALVPPDDSDRNFAPPCGGLPVSQVPTMTSNTSPSGTATRSGVYSSSYEAWHAFDNNNSVAWISKVWEDPAWIAYQWADGPRLITSYSITFTNGSLTGRAPRDWTLQGWNGSSWIVLDTRTNQTNWAGTEVRTFNVANPGAYSKYRLHITRDNDSRANIVVISIAQLDLIGTIPCGCSTINSQVPTMTSNTSPSGTATRSGVYSSSYEAWRAFDNNNSVAWISKVWEDPAWIAYQWADGPRFITEYDITFTNGSLTGRAPRNWTLQGWNGSSWVVLDTRTNETNWAGTEIRTYDVANPGYYSKYRLHITHDNDSRANIVVISIAQLDLWGCQ